MSIAEKVRIKISKMDSGTVFLVSDLPTYNTERNATLQAIKNYLSNETLKTQFGSIRKIADGLYYKEEIGFLGVLPPSYDAVLYALIFSKNKQVGFITGHQLFNLKGLSTQVPATITIVTSKNAPSYVNMDGIKIEIKRKTEKIKENDIKRYEFEHILNNIEKIQSIESDILIDSISSYIDLIYEDNKQFEKLYHSLLYKKTKALLGAMIEEYQNKYELNLNNLLLRIKNDLNEKTTHKLGHISKYIKNKDKWNIKY